MKYKVLISAPYLQNDIELYREELHAHQCDILVYPVKERMEEDELLKHLPGYDGIICGDDRITKRVIDACPELKVIVKWGTGIDSINKEYAATKGIPVFRTPDAFSEPVADSVLGLILSFSRKIVESDNLMKSGKWQKTSGFCLREQTLGIIGLGDVGSAVARRANAFGMKILATDIRPIQCEILKAYDIEMVSLEELLNNSDYISLNCDLNPTSIHIIKEETLKHVKPSSIIINTARGPLIEEVDLIRALSEGKVAGAALDVFENEPLPVESPLRKMSNVLLSSHNVNVSPFYWKKVHRNSLNMLYQGLHI